MAQAAAGTELARRAARRARLFGTALVSGLLVTWLPLPWRLAGLGFGVIAGWTGVRLLIDLTVLRRHGRTGGGFVGVGLGLAATAMMLLASCSDVVLYPLLAERERCDDRAVTHLAAQDCRQTFDRQVQELLDRFRPHGSH